EEEYLAFERASEFKHEYLNGEIFAMSGGSEEHILINANVVTALRTQLRGRPCKLYGSDMRVRVKPGGLYTYPDVSVVCGDAQLIRDSVSILLNPTLIIEILSPSTEAYDRGKKFELYRELESLQEYVLIAQDRPQIEWYLRQEHGFWQFAAASGLNAEAALASISCTLKLAEVYEQIEFPA
ncbi:MAG: Uma2 family endonuclease, partial [Anaerolinea sp.]|nr:Uma2 family endonuclease [Anaerolinea sp.]